MDFPDTDVVVCPKCGSEYQLHVTHCIDCGTPTQSGLAFPGLHRKDRAQRVFSLPPESQAFILAQSRDLGETEGLGAFLEEHGLPWRIEVSEVDMTAGKSSFYVLCVAEGDLDRARELERELLFRQMPELEAAFKNLPAIDQCPGCGSQVSPESDECHSCGLALNGPTIDEAGMESEWEEEDPASERQQR